jgi:hypothetical protein
MSKQTSVHVELYASDALVEPRMVNPTTWFPSRGWLGAVFCESILACIDHIVPPGTVAGTRYPEPGMKMVGL